MSKQDIAIAYSSIEAWLARENRASLVVVDLDGTLIRNDTTQLLLDLHPRFPRRGWSTWGPQRKAGAKVTLARFSKTVVNLMDFDLKLIECLKRGRLAHGFRLVLATGSAQCIAEQVWRRHPFFDEVHGSTFASNLTGTKKGNFLNHRFGSREYDYIGNSEADIAVWNSSRAGLFINRQGNRLDLPPNVEHVQF